MEPVATQRHALPSLDDSRGSYHMMEQICTNVDSGTEEDEGISECSLEISSQTSSDTSSGSPGSLMIFRYLSESGSGPTASRARSLSDSGLPSLSVNALHCLECDGRDDGGFCHDHEFDGFDEYLYETFCHRLDTQNKFHPFACLQNQIEINEDKRKLLVQWITDVHHELKLSQDTLYLTVNTLDRVLEDMQVASDCLEILGLTCLLVASKQNEVCPPEIQELQAKCPDEFSRGQVKQLEVIVLMVTGFDLIVPTVQQFMEYYATFSLKLCEQDERQIYKIKLARGFARCLLELIVQDYQLIQYLPSLLALCVWNAAMDYMHADGNFFPVGMDYPKLKYDVCLMRVRRFIQENHQEWPDMTAVFESYANIHSTK